jgi:flagellar FliL protein
MPMAQFPPRQAGLSKLVLLVIVLVVLLIGSGTTLALYMTGVLGGPTTAPTVAAAAGEAVEAVPAPPTPPIYVPLEPPLVVNFERNGRMGYLQATIQLLARDKTVDEGVKAHMPVIRNNLLMLMSSKTFADVASREGKELLRQEALAEVNKVLEQQSVVGRAEDLYFTGFVMQ